MRDPDMVAPNKPSASAQRLSCRRLRHRYSTRLMTPHFGAGSHAIDARLWLDELVFEERRIDHGAALARDLDQVAVWIAHEHLHLAARQAAHAAPGREVDRSGAFGAPESIGYTLYYATSFIFTGLAVAVAFHGGLFNIGAEGQAYIAGLGVGLFCLGAGRWPAALVIPAAILVAVAGGAAAVVVGAGAGAGGEGGERP